jgi:tRNA(fMet)-specific endonuclease VapC
MFLDTDLCIAVLCRRPIAIRWLQRHSPDALVISSITLFELHRRIVGSDDPVSENNRVAHFLKPFAVLPFSPRAVAMAGGVAAALDRRGQGIGPFDTLIAGHALAELRPVATANMNEFSRVDGLVIDNWRAE